MGVDAETVQEQLEKARLTTSLYKAQAQEERRMSTAAWNRLRNIKDEKFKDTLLAGQDEEAHHTHDVIWAQICINEGWEGVTQRVNLSPRKYRTLEDLHKEGFLNDKEYERFVE